MPFDQRERWNDPEETTRHSNDAQRSDIWTALPVIIKKHDTDKNTAHVQPAVKLKHVKADGTHEWKEFPLLQDVPIHYPGGGGATITVPIKDGDEGLIIFCSRSIDKWWQQGGVQEQNEFRMHDISDGWLIPGGRSQPRKLKNVSKENMQIRTDDGKTYVEFDPTNKKITVYSESDMVVESKTKMTLKAPTIVLDGICLLGGSDASTPASMQGTVDSAGDTDTSNFATKVKLK